MQQQQQLERGGGKVNPFPNFFMEGNRKLHGEERRSAVRDGGGMGATVKQQQEQGMAMPVKPTTALPDAVITTDKLLGDLPPLVQRKVQQQSQRDLSTLQEGPGIRLRGKLKWLFEQDRMFWESNSAKSSRRGSPEREKGSKAVTPTPTTSPTRNKTGGECSTDDPKIGWVVAEEGVKKVDSNSKKLFPKDGIKKPPRQSNNSNDKATKAAAAAATPNLPTAKVPWTFSNSAAKFWPRGGKSKSAQNPNKVPTTVESKSKAHQAPAAARQSSVEHHNTRLESNDSATLMSSSDVGAGGRFFSASENVAKSGDASDLGSSDEDEDKELRRRVDVVIARGGNGSLKDVKNQAAYLKVKCDMLSKEKARAVRKWKKGCLEIDEAAKMAQALRTAIETLLEAGAIDSRADFKARQDILEGQTQALKIRMEKLRRKNTEGLQRQSETAKRSSKSLVDRIETLKKTSEGRSLASPEIPRDTEHKVEALRARLEKLMVATNSLVTDEQGQAQGRAREQKKPAEDSVRLKTHLNEKGELKMKGWFKSLSAELTSEESPGTSRGAYGDCNGARGGFLLREMDFVGTPFSSKRATPSPSTSIQVSPLHPAQERERNTPGSAPSEEKKKKVIHKIAEEVKLEAEQWFQVQELLGRVGEDMKSLQEACSTWERRAILAEAQVNFMQQEGQEPKERTLQIGDEKIAELQREMLQLRKTVEEVKKQLGNVSVDPNRWFEAAHNFGYAFMPVNFPIPSCSCKGKCNCSSSYKGTPDSNDRWRQKGAAAAGNNQPSSSANTSTAPSAITSSATTPAESEMRQRTQLPSQQWANEIVTAEDDDVITSVQAVEQFSKLESANNTIKEMFPASAGKLQEKPAKLFYKEPGLESSGSRGDMLLQMHPSSTRERCSILHQEDHVSRYSIFNNALRRSPLRDVLENIASSKENKRPF